ncbi:cupin domain-containing protein [Streptomyces luteolifulvus]|jgi:quercetin dioxygenase-like cupin family protein|uniref:Cupin domain-containing protein n=1 Tax=Streptomyces luteolifulvus TaxID=2615112 RepID=A0A6H9URD9_9ACTN|nr:cupin domain-containing protein [Streptomyces luteolifulvus]KAB1141545.1 cupin domain-containing protein [Streptomyces luteolifulvus]
MTRHVVHRSADVPPPPYDGHGYRRRTLVGEDDGSVHTGFGLCELRPDGRVGAHVHSYEESFHVLDGTMILDLPEGAYLLAEGDYGLLPAGVPHAWRGAGETVARWADMLAPVPRARYGYDTQAVPDLPVRSPVRIDVRDPRTRSFGHFEPGQMDPGKQSQELLAVSASMRTALLVYSGITVKMMVDSDLGAVASTMFMVQYAPDGVAGTHDHPFEETYLFLEGTADAVFDGERYRLGPGDLAWAGAGCVHGFANAGRAPLRWLETQAPQPPARHSYRFTRDWDYLREALES